MDYKERYVYRLNRKGTSDVDSINYATKQTTNQLFDKSPSYVSLLLNGTESDGIINKTISSLEKEIMFRTDTVIKHGDLVTVGDKNYLITKHKDIDLFPYATVKLCNYTLKFQQSNTIHTISCVVYNSSLISDGTSEDKYMRLPKGQLGILIQNNELTNKFVRDNRFFVNKDVWRVDYIYDLNDGILDITLVSDQIDLTKDNVELGIADYVEVVEEPEIPSTGYTCEITGDTSIINNSTKTYTVRWLNNGTEISDTISSVNLSNTSLATITFTGNSITITADRINKGIMTMTVTSVSGIVGAKDIEIKGLW